MPSVSCRCRFPSFLYRVYQPTLRRAEASPRACVALCGVRARPSVGGSRVRGNSQVGQRRGRLPETSPAALHPVVFRQRQPFKAMDRRTALQDRIAG